MRKIGFTFKFFVIAIAFMSIFPVSCKSQGGKGKKVANTDADSKVAEAPQEFNVNDFIGDWKSDDGWYMHFTYRIESEDDKAVFIHDGEKGFYYQAGGTDDFMPDEYSALQLPHHALGYVPHPGAGPYDGGELYFDVANQTIIYDTGAEQIVFKRIKSTADTSKIKDLMYEKDKVDNKLEAKERQIIKNNSWLIGRWVLRSDYNTFTIEFKENGTVWSEGERCPVEYNAADETLYINLGGDGPTVDLKNRTIEFGGYFKKQ